MLAEGSVDSSLARARQAAKAKDWLSATRCYQSILGRYPKNARARHGLAELRPVALPELIKSAQAARSEGNWIKVEDNLFAAAGLAPQLTDVHLALANCRLEMGRAPAALRVAERVLQSEPDHIEALNIKGRALREMSKSEASEACLRHALNRDPKNPKTLNNLGILKRAQGDRTAAADCFRRAARIQPDNAVLHRNLAYAITYLDDEPHLEEMKGLLATSNPSDPDMAPLYFAMFKALDELGGRAEAFALLEQGNRLAKAGLQYDFQRDAIPYALSRRLFENPVETLKADGALTPIFITGLPRSGTTLLERILSRATGVQPCGELTVVQSAVGRLLQDVMARDDKSLKRHDLGSLRETLLDDLSDYSDGRPVIIDKMPLNFRWIGFIRAVLPEAKVVHVSRSPIAVAWSLYRHMFTGTGIGFAYDPSDIARYMVMHDELMAFWRSRFRHGIIDVQYDTLVADPSRVTQDLAKAVGLEWTPDWLEPERADTLVLTASSEQVRQSIYGGSSGAWRAYQEHLSPLLAALDAVGFKQ